MKILTAEQMREVDRVTSEQYGIPSLALMENAGKAIADFLCESYPELPRQRVLVLCGKGNNGGDGLVVARLLRERGTRPRVILFAQPEALRGDAAANLQRWQQARGDLQVITSEAEWNSARAVIGQSDLIVDALLGTGLSGPVQGLLAAVIEAVNSAGRATVQAHVRDGNPPPETSLQGSSRRPQVVSVDMPSGLPSGTEDFGGPIIAADATVTLTAPKVGQLLNPRCDGVGKLLVRSIGSPAKLVEGDPRLTMHWIDPAEFAALPMIRKPDANKGNYGHALVVAGSLGKSGAAALSGRSALRVGAGLVTVATPLGVLPIVAASMPELMTTPLLSNEAGSASLRNIEHFESLTAGKSVLAIGPGLSGHEDTQQFIRAVLAQSTLPVILDADGLNAFAAKTGMSAGKAVVAAGKADADADVDVLAAHKTPLLAITPHPGEMGRLLGITAAEVQSRRLQIALDAAVRWRAYVVLKGFHTILATPDGQVFVNTTGNPGMATGGTGDVLTGMLAGLTAEFGTAHWECVLALGIYLHGLAGDAAAAKVGEAPLVASDLIDALPAVFADFLQEWKHGRG